MLKFKWVIKMKWISEIKNIGSEALAPEERVVILFGENANDDLKKVSVIQNFEDEDALKSLVLKKGDTVTIDGTTYLINYVGSLVNSNLRALQHVSLFFTKTPKKPMSNAVYLECDEKDALPDFRVNDEIVYEHL